MKKAATAIPNDRLIEERLHRRWLQKEVADRIGTTPINVCRWERGITIPSAHFRCQLCTLYEKSAEELGLLPDEKSENGTGALKGAPTIWNGTGASLQTAFGAPTIWKVPYRRNLFFTGRDGILQCLSDVFAAHSEQICSLYGLGGIGKTQVAIEYAYRYRHRYTTVLWVRADTLASLTTDFVANAEILHISTDERDPQSIVAAVRDWLEKHARWLLIFDNVEDVQMIRNFFPSTGEGHILLTTRSQITGSLAYTLEIPRMPPAESSVFLLRRAKYLLQDASVHEVADEKRSAAEVVAQLLDGHPLALDQAGAYIEEIGCTISDYVELYRRFQRDLLQRRGKQAIDHPDSVTVTLLLCVNKIRQIDPVAIDLLSLCTFFYTEAFPEEYLLSRTADVSPWLQSVVGEPLQLNEAISHLLSYSLLKRDTETKSMTIHRLVQYVLRDMLTDEQQKHWALRAIWAVNEIFPESNSETWSQCQRCLPQAQYCFALMHQYQLLVPELAQLCYKSGLYLLDCAQYTAAEDLLQQALAMYEQLSSSIHAEAAGCLNALGAIDFMLGKYEQAESFFQRALLMRQQLYGKEHSATAESFNDLAALYYRQGQYLQAEQFSRQALAIWEKMLGPEHYNVAISLNNLAKIYLTQGVYDQAEALLQRALKIWTKAVGSKDPDIAFALSNLAKLYQAQQKYRKAEKLFQRSLAIREKTLGREHLRVAISLNDLASLYRDQSEYQQAEILYLRALSIQKKILGPKHPDVEACIHNLAEIRKLLSCAKA